jgi:hypothetical protein
MHLTDTVTGRIFNENERIVALLLQRRMHGHPDPIKACAFRPLYPNEYFEPVSFPIMGKAGPESSFVPDDNQIAADLAIAYGDASDWCDLTTKAFSKEGVKVIEFRIHKDDTVDPQRFALFTISHDTYRALQKASRNRQEKAWSVDTIHSSLVACRDLTLNKNTELSDRERYVAWNATMTFRAPEQTADGKHIDMPVSNRVLSEGDDSVGIGARRFIGHRWKFAEDFRQGVAGTDDKLRQFLASAYDHFNLMKGLDHHSFTLRPSSLGFASSNNFETAKRLIDIAKEDIATVVLQHTKNYDYEDDFQDRLNPLATKIAEIKKQISDELQRTPAYKG